MFAAWMDSAASFWEDILKAQTDMPGIFSGNDASHKKTVHQARQSWETSSKIFQSLLSTLSKPENMESLLKGLDAAPDYVMSLTRQAWDGYVELQKQWMEKASKIGQQTKAYNFEDIDQDTFRAIRELYEKEFQKFLNVPALGLTRFYQERFNRMIDRHTIFQTCLSEFLYLFYVPIEKTGAVMNEKLQQMAETGEIHDDFKTYYNMWVRILEGHYMTLLKSPEYTQVMDKTIQSLVEYKEARNNLLCDVLQQLPIPTNREMDELYKEFYLLKKQVRELSQKVNALAPETD